jgi:hypothetical protein
VHLCPKWRCKQSAFPGLSAFVISHLYWSGFGRWQWRSQNVLELYQQLLEEELRVDVHSQVCAELLNDLKHLQKMIELQALSKGRQISVQILIV